MKYRSGNLIPDMKLLDIDKATSIPCPNDSFIERTSPTNEAARRMEVGDSICIPYTRSPIAHNMHRATGFTFTQRKHGIYLRIWRIK